MSSRRIRSHGLSERAAFEKLQGAIAYTVEACRELGMYRSDDNWSKISLVFEEVGRKANELFIASQANAKLIVPN